MNTHKELHEGTNGDGSKKYMVVTVCNETDRWIHTESFTNENEAKNWMEWA